MNRAFLLFACALFAIVARADTSVTQYGITWTFNTNYTIGQYANGDYYVVAPSGLTITGISPASIVSGGRTINGSEVNPASAPNERDQGFDSWLYNTSGSHWDPALNAARPGGNDLSAGNPLVITAGSSLMSVISNPDYTARPDITDGAILTIVSSAPSSGSFRPSPYGTAYSHTNGFNKASLNYSIFRSLTPTASTPALATVEAYMTRPWFEFETGPFCQNTMPSSNGPNYGREISWEVADCVLSLNLNYTNGQKELTLIRLVQYGIDCYGAAAYSGGIWTSKAGTTIGRKLPVVVAGLALNDAGILAYANAATHFVFAEDQQTWNVIASDAATVNATVTITNASPAVVTWTGNAFFYNQPITFATTGALPTGITAGTTYYVRTKGSTNPVGDTFQITLTKTDDGSGTAINTSSAGSGVQTGTYQGRPLINTEPDRPRDVYIPSDVTTPEMGEQHTTYPPYDGRNWATMVYRPLINQSYLGTAIGGMLTLGGVSAWNWDVFFNYNDRSFPNEIVTAPFPPFHKEMWTAYRSLVSNPPVTTQWDNGPYLSNTVGGSSFSGSLTIGGNAFLK